MTLDDQIKREVHVLSKIEAMHKMQLASMRATIEWQKGVQDVISKQIANAKSEIELSQLQLHLRAKKRKAYQIKRRRRTLLAKGRKYDRCWRNLTILKKSMRSGRFSATMTRNQRRFRDMQYLLDKLPWDFSRLSEPFDTRVTCRFYVLNGGAEPPQSFQSTDCLEDVIEHCRTWGVVPRTSFFTNAFVHLIENDMSEAMLKRVNEIKTESEALQDQLIELWS